MLFLQVHGGAEVFCCRCFVLNGIKSSVWGKVSSLPLHKYSPQPFKQYIMDVTIYLLVELFVGNILLVIDGSGRPIKLSNPLNSYSALSHPSSSSFPFSQFRSNWLAGLSHMESKYDRKGQWHHEQT